MGAETLAHPPFYSNSIEKLRTNGSRHCLYHISLAVERRCSRGVRWRGVDGRSDSTAFAKIRYAHRDPV